MATEARKFQLGVFLIAAMVIGVAALIWLGASRFFEKTEHVVTYLEESVQGLEPGSAVKYRGVPAGRVEHIRVAPDKVLIEIIMSTRPEFAQLIAGDVSLRAQVELAGITGLRYVEIDRHTGDALWNHPQLNFEPPYPVVPSVPSSFTAIEIGLKQIYDRVTEFDFEGISTDIRTTLQSADTLLRDERVGDIMTNLKNVSHSADRVTKNLDRLTGDLQLGPAVENLTQATAEARDLFSDLQSGASGTRLRNALTAIERVAESTQQVVIGLQYTVQRFDRTVASLERLSEEVRNQPSRLLFAEPPPPRRPGDGGQP
jgi:phospholipid/cholesterol/gamma-HCH transport system substrate-binding protein